MDASLADYTLFYYASLMPLKNVNSEVFNISEHNTVLQLLSAQWLTAHDGSFLPEE